MPHTDTKVHLVKREVLIKPCTKHSQPRNHPAYPYPPKQLEHGMQQNVIKPRRLYTILIV